MIKIRAKEVTHSKHVTLRMAEVAVPRDWLAAILIALLVVLPDPAIGTTQDASKTVAPGSMVCTSLFFTARISAIRPMQTSCWTRGWRAGSGWPAHQG